MENRNKLVSIIVPVYNSDEFMEACINSVIHQTYSNWELLIIDDGSTDESFKIAKKYSDGKKIFVLQHPNGVNKGVSMSRAVGLGAAKGDFISLLDADDLYENNKLEKNIHAFGENKEVILIHSCANFIDSSTSHHTFYNEFKFDKLNIPYSFLDSDFLNANHICNSSVMVKAEYLKKISNSFTHLFQYEDWINWILLAEQGQFLYIDQALCSYRFHDASSTSYLLNNELRSMYARLEMLFILLQRLESKSLKENIKTALMEQLEKVYSYYQRPGVENNAMQLFEIPELKRQYSNKVAGKIRSLFKN